MSLAGWISIRGKSLRTIVRRTQRLGCMVLGLQTDRADQCLDQFLDSESRGGVAFLKAACCLPAACPVAPSIAPSRAFCSDAPATLMVSVFFDMSFRDIIAVANIVLLRMDGSKSVAFLVEHCPASALMGPNWLNWEGRISGSSLAFQKERR